MTESSFSARVEFVLQLASRLHNYGTTAQRLEGAITAVATRLGLRCSPWSNPTGLILSFSDLASPNRMAESTQVIRLEPGDTDLRKLCQADAIAEKTLSGELGIEAATAALLALDREPGWRAQALSIVCFGLASASVAGLLRASWADIATAGIIGWLIGAMYTMGAKRPRLAESVDAIAALIATLLAAAVATFVVPLATKVVVVASVIVLMPGLMLTNAVQELTSQHLVSGTARFAGAFAVLLKLTFGSVAAAQLAALLGWVPQERPDTGLAPAWVEWTALALAGYAFAVLFKADRRDYPTVMLAVVAGYAITRIGGHYFGSGAGVFLASMAITALSNVYARVMNRPGALVRVPGIILLVPGSVGFRGMSLVLERDVALGLDTGFLLIALLVSLVAGVLFGNLLYPARRNL
ncbi:threonine/serine ThrE exporter family protein [Chiayiivirga flava]|uniref:Uncharacterized membrane protein YjjP (DUF1212 family) n=1 Tax=Chiayiivirga flava TaxID=659595 RepID=A0A7W8D6Y0_9GAMM|nr:threonine/serine exporter family protein [Chiayiivirga flava]MBB5208662.1 uncharacterized membrane protein YjjP (DUF1212 family) [Chiayiivirga flava]